MWGNGTGINDFYRSTGLPVTIVTETEIEKEASCL